MATGRRINLKDKKGNIVYPNIHNLITIDSATGALNAPKLTQNGIEVMTKTDKEAIEEQLSKIDEQFLKIYPVGAVYINVDGRNPSTLVGGTWEQFGQGRTLIGVNIDDGSFNEALKIGGDKEITLSASQIPSHNHSFTGAGHTHDYSGNTGNESDDHAHVLPSHTHGMIANHNHGMEFWSGNQSADHAHWFEATTGWVSHDHGHGGNTSSDGAHNHTVKYKGFSGMTQSTGGYMVLRRNDGNDAYDGTDSDAAYGGGHNHSIATGGINTNHYHGVGNWTGGINAAHSHYIAGWTWGPAATNNTSDWSGDLGTWGVTSHHTHGFSGTTTSTTQSGSIGNTGGGGAHSNLQPYITVYFWRRTA